MPHQTPTKQNWKHLFSILQPSSIWTWPSVLTSASFILLSLHELLCLPHLLPGATLHLWVFEWENRFDPSWRGEGRTPLKVRNLAVDPASPVWWGLQGPDWFVPHIPQMLRQLEVFVMFLPPSLNSVFQSVRVHYHEGISRTPLLRNTVGIFGL